MSIYFSFLFRTQNFTVLFLSIICSCFIHTDLYNILLNKTWLVLNFDKKRNPKTTLMTTKANKKFKAIFIHILLDNSLLSNLNITFQIFFLESICLNEL